MNNDNPPIGLSKEALQIAALIKGSKKSFNIRRYCFDRQLSFISDKARFKTAVCSRRSGKTVSCAADLISHSLEFGGRTSLYITLSKLNARKIIWETLLGINRDYELGAKVNETLLSLSFANGSKIYLSGASDRTEIENFRGLALSLCYIDEAQAFPDYIRNMVDDVIAPALFDHNGRLCLIGTPGPVPSGYFYESSSNPEWSHHAWTMFDNPWLYKKSGKTPQELLDQELKRKGVPLDDPSIQRECFAKWVTDPNALVFRYDPARNDSSTIPDRAGEASYIIGVDIGYDDSDAIAVIGWGEKEKKAYLIEEFIRAKQGITELATEIDRLVNKYNPIRVVMDTGGLGKKISEELQRRFQLPIVAAEKVRKFEFIELLNDAMRTQRFFADRKSRFAQDCFLVEWDRDAALEKPKVSDRYHSDITDAVLYAFRESLHWLSEPEIPKPKIFTPEWYQKEQQEMEEAARRSLEETQDDPWARHDPSWGEQWE